MRTTRMPLVSGLLVVGLLMAPLVVGRAQQDAPEPLVNATKKRMHPEEAATGGNIYGSTGEPGIYTMRAKFEAGRLTRPHYHTQERWVTVITGTWWTGEGEVFDEDSMIPIKAGGFMYHPAGFIHYDGGKDEDVLVQITGVGPVETVFAELDEDGNPVSR